MFGIGSTELLVILLVALVVLGPKSLAGVAKSLGKAMGEFRRVSTDFQRTLNMEAAEEDARAKKAAREKAEKASGKSSAAAEEPVKPESGERGTLGNIPPDSPVAQAIERAKLIANEGTSSVASERDPHA